MRGAASAVELSGGHAPADARVPLWHCLRGPFPTWCPLRPPQQVLHNANFNPITEREGGWDAIPPQALGSDGGERNARATVTASPSNACTSSARSMRSLSDASSASACVSPTSSTPVQLGPAPMPFTLHGKSSSRGSVGGRVPFTRLTPLKIDTGNGRLHAAPPPRRNKADEASGLFEPAPMCTRAPRPHLPAAADEAHSAHRCPADVQSGLFEPEVRRVARHRAQRV